MCGITGIFEYASGRKVNRADLEPMVEVLRHRGPDDCGFFVNPELGLGMRRLSIVDPDSGHQPMSNEDGSVIAVTNGEIYNFGSLRAELLARGHDLVTDCDTEVVAHLYEEHGPGFVRFLRGMFALAVWDAKRHQLLLARDRIGIKPLYYRDVGGRLLFGSEIKAIAQHPSASTSPDFEAMALYLALRYVPSPATMFSGIRSLLPGSMLIVNAEGVRSERYWNLPFPRTGERRTADEWADELHGLLRDSVKLHLQADVPFGAFLSGGLDSSLIVALMNEVLPERVKTFAVGFEAGSRPYGELSYSALVAREFATDHHELVMTGKDFLAAVPRAIWHLDQPVGDVAAVPMLALSEMAGRHVKMVLSGEGGDELFGGYARYAGEQLAFLLRPLPSRLRSFVLKKARLVARGTRPRIALHALSRRDNIARMANWFPLFNDDLRAELLSPAFASATPRWGAEATLRDALPDSAGSDVVSNMMYCDTKLWLPDTLLARGDKMSMAASVELRVPLLDHHVVEFAAGVPRALKVRGRERKVLLRNVAFGLLPPAVLERRKEGFPVPLSHWLRDEARELVGDVLAPSTVNRRGFFDSQFISRLVGEHQARQADHATLLWGLVVLELWFQRFMDPNSVSADGTWPIGAGSR